jgi:hypothetical protein
LVLMQSHGIADACPTTVHACIWIMLDYHLLCIEKNITSASTMSDVTVLRQRTTTTKMASAA